MSWRVVAASAVGTAHEATGAACQDSVRAAVRIAPDGHPLLSIFVADGAGSATHGGEGAELATQTAEEYVAARPACDAGEPTESFAARLVSAIRERIGAAAAAGALAPRDFACTFLGIVSSSRATAVMQIGDGAVVADFGAGLELVFPPMSGEYANTTHFVTDEDALDRLAARRYAGPVRCAAAFSDGLQRLVLDMAACSPHAPLFERLFRVVTEAGAGRQGDLESALQRFLDSGQVNERTDDDKTLALAVLLN